MPTTAFRPRTLLAALGLAALASAALPSAAHAQFIGRRVVVAPSYYVAPAPTYVAPASTYVAPAPVTTVYAPPVATTYTGVVPAGYTATSTVVAGPVATAYSAPAVATYAPTTAYYPATYAAPVYERIRPGRIVVPRQVYRYPY